jgi:hypothetical protein
VPNRTRHPIGKQIRAIRRSAREIEQALTRLAGLVGALERSAVRAQAAPGKRTLRLTPKRRATLRMQGAYMGYMRQLGPRQKAKAKAVKEKRGFPAAIAVARKLAGK